MKRVLIVDDQSVIRWMIRLALREHFIIDEADNAQAAWAQVRKRPPDAMILDVLMPGSSDGFQFCERIKREPELASIHVVLVTACGDEKDLERGRIAGADGYFLKPLSPLALSNYLRATLYGTDVATILGQTAKPGEAHKP